MPGYPLYDSYRLSNSNAIPQYEGSTGETAIKVGQYMQGLYDQGQQGAGEISSNLDNLTSLPWHQDAVNEVRQHVQSQLDGLARKGDYENAVPAVQSLGRWYSSRANELMAPVKQRQDYIKSLDEYNKGKDGELTGYQKQGLISMSDEQAKQAGSPKDAFGRYNLQYSGSTPDKNIDVNAKVDKLLKDAAVQKGGTEWTTGIDGDWLVKNGEKFEKMPTGTIQRIVQDGLSNDQEYQSYKSMMGKIDGHMNTRSISDPAQLPDMVGGKANILKQHAIQLAQQRGIPFRDALQSIVSSNTENQIDNTALDYATSKYQMNNHWTTQDVKENAYRLKLLQDNTPYMAQGANIQTSADEQDYSKVQDNIKNLNMQGTDVSKQLKYYTGQLADTTLKPADRSSIEATVNSLKNQQSGIDAQQGRLKQLSDYSKLKTAQGMGYTGYDDFLKSQLPSVVANVKKIYPYGLISNSGIKLHPEDIAQAIIEKRLDPQLDLTPAAGGMYGQGTAIMKGINIHTKDGKVVFVGAGNKANELNNLINSTHSDNSLKVGQFDDLNTKNYQDNVKNFSIQSTSIALNDKEQKDLSTFLKNPGTNFTKPGEYGILAAGDRPANFRVVSANDTRGPNGESRVTVEELDKDNKPTGNYYDALSSNSNVSDILSRNLAKQPTPEAQQASQVMRSGSGADMLKNKTPGSIIPLGKVNDKGATKDISIKVQSTNGTITYDLVDEKGNILKTAGSTAEAGRWIEAYHK